MKALAVSGIISFNICQATVKKLYRVSHYTIMKITIPKTNPPAANSFLNLPVDTDWQNLQVVDVVLASQMASPLLLINFQMTNRLHIPATLDEKVKMGGVKKVLDNSCWAFAKIPEFCQICS